ncbi:efflux RND transporter periplasmic adaptor subunit [Legionella sp. km772]|uniref:efflux RND transporter periplasmic adaptor subunit n=1 Tax=Legionella sp. km772 TaxID=2498111 RepID=UPI0018F6D20F|nr:efflux RND transporter periplasmic adaptor subunit [Legionella sp. km772]
MNQEKKSKQTKVIVFIAVLVLAYFVIQHFTKKEEITLPLPVVVVQKPVLADMIEFVTQTGTTVAFNSVNLVARVSGYLNSIEFVDGTFVKKGTELFVIQPEPYWEQLLAAQATVAANQAAYDYAKLEYERQQRMYKQNATSLNNVQKWLAKMDESKAELDKSKADEVNAQINYSYTHISAPFDGRIGRHLVDIGNLVGNGVATNLATIDQVDKLYVYFNLNELDLIKLRAAARASGFKPADIHKIPVYINFQNETGYKHKATLDFVNTGLNASTGTMELRALLENKDNLFVPGLFVQVQIAVSQPKKQLTIPSTAILYDQIGPYVLIVDKDDVVQLKHIDLGVAENGKQAVTKGISADERVIVDGLQNASPGNKVEIQGAQKTAA